MIMCNDNNININDNINDNINIIIINDINVCV